MVIPNVFSIHNIYPNPFNPEANIIYTLPKNSDVKIAVYDIRGAVVAILENSFKTSGYYTVQWNAAGFASGVYFIEMLSGDFREIKKVIHMK